MDSRRRGRLSERGAAALEFALVVPLLIVLVFGMVDCGWAINRYAVINNAVREGARTASLGGDTADVNLAFTDSLDAKMIAGNPVVTVICKTSANVTKPCGTAEVSGGTATVKAEVTQGWLTPVMSTFNASGVQLSKEMKMRIE